jgi:hypothetical protein
MLAVTISDTSQTEYNVVTAFVTFDGTGGNRTAKIDAEHTKFVRLIYKGSVVDPNNYSITEGSTIITLKESHLKTLANGTHWFIAEFSDGISQPIRLDVYVDADLDVDVDANVDLNVDVKDVKVSQTGDNSNISLWLWLGGTALLCLGGMFIAVWKRHRAVR